MGMGMPMNMMGGMGGRGGGREVARGRVKTNVTDDLVDSRT